jgi:hypothetical protein
MTGMCRKLEIALDLLQRYRAFLAAVPWLTKSTCSALASRAVKGMRFALRMRAAIGFANHLQLKGRCWTYYL